MGLLNFLTIFWTWKWNWESFGMSELWNNCRSILYSSVLLTHRSMLPHLPNFFVANGKHSQSSWKRWSCASLLLFAHRRSGAMVVLHIVHPRLAASEGSGCTHSSLSWSELPLQTRQILGLAYQECVKIQWPICHSLLCSCLSCIGKWFVKPAVKIK